MRTGVMGSLVAEYGTETRQWFGAATAGPDDERLALPEIRDHQKSRLSGCRGFLEVAGVGHRGRARPGGDVRQKVPKWP